MNDERLLKSINQAKTKRNIVRLKDEQSQNRMTNTADPMTSQVFSLQSNKDLDAFTSSFIDVFFLKYFHSTCHMIGQSVCLRL